MPRPWQVLVGCSQQCAGQCGWWIVLRRSDKATWHHRAAAGPSRDNLVINTGHWTSYTFISVSATAHQSCTVLSISRALDTSKTTSSTNVFTLSVHHLFRHSFISIDHYHRECIRALYSWKHGKPLSLSGQDLISGLGLYYQPRQRGCQSFKRRNVKIE